MKAMLLLLGLVAAQSNLFGQGQIFFSNDSTTRFTTNTGPGHVGLMTGVNAYRIGLYVAPAGTVNETFFTLLAVATNSSSPIAPGQFSYPESPYTFAANSGTPIAVQVRAWSLSAGSTYEAAVASGGSNPNVLFGKTPIGAITPAVGGATPPSLFGASGVFTSGIVLGVPEPSTCALATLGALLFFCLRQRRAAK